MFCFEAKQKPVNGLILVPSTRIELVSMAPQAITLSVELRGLKVIITQTTCFFNLLDF